MLLLPEKAQSLHEAYVYEWSIRMPAPWQLTRERPEQTENWYPLLDRTSQLPYAIIDVLSEEI